MWDFIRHLLAYAIVITLNILLYLNYVSNFFLNSEIQIFFLGVQRMIPQS